MSILRKGKLQPPVGNGGGAFGNSGAIIATGGGSGLSPRLLSLSQNPLPGGKTAKAPSSYNSGAYRVTIPASGYVQFPGVLVPAGAVVRIRAHNGTNAGNANPVAVVDSFDAAISPTTPGDPINPDDEMIYPADNLARLWLRGTPGDGAVASIRQDA